MFRFIVVLFCCFFSLFMSAQDGVYTTIESAPALGGNKNQGSSISFDYGGVTLSKSRGFYNSMSKSEQSQSWDVLSDTIWTSQVLYDRQGRPALSTLSAPTGIAFGFDTNFLLDSGNGDFDYSDFDTGGSISNPDVVGTSSDLRTYYNATNTQDKYQDITSYPYSRAVYSKLNPGSVHKVLGGNKIAGEWKQSYTFDMTAGTELRASNAFGLGYGTTKVFKKVVRDVHGIETVVFTDGEGNTLAAARSGNEAGTQASHTTQIDLEDQGFVDIHLPTGVGSFTVTNNGVSDNGGIRVYNLITETFVGSSTSSSQTFSPGAGFYRISVVDPVMYANENHLIRVTHQVNYYDYSLNEYDRTGRLLSSKQPLGHQESTFNYNSLGQLLNTTSPDEGTSNFIYRTDGQIRFSQNSKQALAGEFSYTNYDEWGRPIDSGVYTGVFPDESEADSWNASCGPEGAEPPTDFIYTRNIDYYADVDISWKVTGTRFFAGLDQDANASNWTNTIYGLYCNNGQLLPTLHGTCVSGSIGSYTSNDVLRIVRIGDYVLFIKNDTVLYSIDTLETTPLGIEGGVYIASSTGELTNDYTVSSDVDTSQPIPDAMNFGSPCKEQVFTMYDLPDDGLEAILMADSCGLADAGYKQHFVGGNVSKTWTMRPKTNMAWYSYDVLGRVEWIIQKNPGMSCATTIDYSYDPATSQVTQVDFQRHNVDERFVHKYEYNVGGQLTRVLTSRDGEVYEEQARYAYNASGALVRTVLGEDLQGIDYVYNLNGQLKGINHPSLDPSKDPGNDGNNGVVGDVFGMAIDYYDGDYARPNTPTPVAQLNPTGEDQYNGNIKSIRYQTKGTSTQQQFSAYQYQYDKNNWLRKATFGSGTETPVSGGRHQVSYNPDANEDYAVKDITYDANGNIQTLTRNGYTDATGTNDMDDFDYVYQDGGNKLAGVKDGGDNPDVDRYNDLKNQTDTNYSYNSIGQLVFNKQEGTTYAYNASGLVTRIGGFSATDTGMYETIYEENFNGISGESFANTFQNGTAQIADPVCSGGEPFEKQLAITVNNVPGYQTIATAPGAFHRVTLDAFFNNFNEPIINQGFTIAAVATDGTVLDSFTFYDIDGDGNTDNPDSLTGGDTNSSTRSNCDWSFHDVQLTFVSPQDYIHLNFTTATFEDHGTSVVIDNLKLEVATEDKLRFTYDDRGQRIKKEVYSEDEIYTTHYVRDLSGSPMGIYSSSTIASNTPKQRELPIYGQSRVGVYNKSETNTQEGTAVYQLADHLGNVRAVITEINGNAVSLTSKADYYPFGMTMPDKTQEGDYRYAYQGQEKDPETGKEAFELRLWDSRIGRWLSPDPYGEFSSPYLGMGNNPTKFVDIDGGRIQIWHKSTSGKITIYEYRNGELYDGNNKKYSGSDAFLNDVRSALKKLDYLDIDTGQSLEQSKIVTTGFVNFLVKSKQIFSIHFASGSMKTSGTSVYVDPSNDPSIPVYKKNKANDEKKSQLKKRPFSIGLIHELGHAFDNAYDISSKEEWLKYDSNGDGTKDSSLSFQEQFGSAIENVYRSKLGLPLRNYYLNGVKESLLLNSAFQTIWTNSSGQDKILSPRDF